MNSEDHMDIIDDVANDFRQEQEFEYVSIFPESIFEAARSEDPVRRQNVENFILSRLSRVSSDVRSPVESEEHHDLDMCTALVRSIEDSLECPVCRDRVHGEIYQCHAGHVMCSTCRCRLLTCPVCRSLLTLPPIRNRALEKLACILA